MAIQPKCRDNVATVRHMNVDDNNNEVRKAHWTTFICLVPFADKRRNISQITI